MLLQRMLRAAMLDPAVYNDLRRDRSANGQAIAVVLIVAVCSLIGARVLAPTMVISSGLCAFVNWLFVAFVVTLVANRYRVRAEFDELIRPLAFSLTPGVLMILALVPGWSLPLSVGVWLWQTAALFVAVREVLRLENREAGVTVLLTTLALLVLGLITNYTNSAFGNLMLRMRLWIAGL